MLDCCVSECGVIFQMKTMTVTKPSVVLLM